MMTLHPGADPERFFTALAHAPRAALLLDYDGTLAPFHIDPHQATPYPGVPAALAALMDDTDTRVVIVSGRWTRDLLPLLGLERLPEIWGSHGWERRFPDGRIEMPHPPEAALRALAAADGWIGQVHASGARSERKPAGLAVHWRGLAPADVERVRETVTANWAIEARASGLELHPFDGGIELRIPGRHKGDVVDTIRAEMPGATLAYLGDDATDEDAFDAIRDHGLGVLVRGERRATGAGLWLQPPGELLDFLARWTAARAAERP